MLRTVATSLMSWREQSPRPLDFIHICLVSLALKLADLRFAPFRVRRSARERNQDGNVSFDPFGLLAEDGAQVQGAFADFEALSACVRRNSDSTPDPLL